MLLVLTSVNVYSFSKAEIKASLDKMRTTGMFTEEQLKQAEKQLMGMDQKQIDAIVKKGQEGANDPALKAKAEELLKNHKKLNNQKK
jgi:hypothetical protein